MMFGYIVILDLNVTSFYSGGKWFDRVLKGDKETIFMKVCTSE